MEALIEAGTAAAFTDIHHLDQLKSKLSTGKASNDQLEEAASAFESLFVDLWIKSMREAGAVFSEGSYLSSESTKFHQEMLDDQWAVELSEAGGLGLREVIMRQLSGIPNPTSHLTDRADNSAMTVKAPSAAQENSAKPPTADSVETPANVAGSVKEADFASARAFIDKLLPAIREALNNTPFNPIVVLAQAALETGWGQSVIQNGEGESSHNLFGVKASADSTQDSVSANTLEFLGGRFVSRQESFRSYENWVDSIRDYANLIQGSDRYQDAMTHAQDPEKYAQGLQKGGYATDPDYATKILRVMNQIKALLP